MPFPEGRAVSREIEVCPLELYGITTVQVHVDLLVQMNSAVRVDRGYWLRGWF